MVEDVVAETMDYIADSAARCLLNSVPMPIDAWEQKMVDNFCELYADLLAESVNKIVCPPWYVRLWDWFAFPFRKEN